jgi:hypothetical protein
MSDRKMSDDTIVEAACIHCRYLITWGKCFAFPDGIPKEILDGENDHSEPFDGDNGLQFKPSLPGGKLPPIEEVFGDI